MVKTDQVRMWTTKEQKERMVYWQERAGFPTLASYVRAAALRAGPLLVAELPIPELDDDSRRSTR